MLEARTTPFPAARATTAAVGRILDGLEREEARRSLRQRPFVTLSWAQSLDGCIARTPGTPTALSGEATRGMTHALRAAHDAILIGVGTLLADDPALTVRFWNGANPAPIVLDSRLRTPCASRLVLSAGARPVTFACTAAGDPGRQRQLEACGAKVLRLPACSSQWVDLAALLARLGEAGVQRLMVEGGAKVLTSFLRSGLADYAIVTIAPRLLGGLPAVARVAGELQQLEAAAYERFGPDMVMAGPLGEHGVNRQALVFVRPGLVEVIEEPCPAPAAGEVLVETRVSAISAGTELLAYRGQLPADLPLDETLAALGGWFRYPFRYGYATAGVIAAVGAGVGKDWVGRRVFAFAPHASAFVVPASEVFAVPAGITDEVASLLASAETASNLVLDGRPQLGERVVVFGQGVVGLLLTSLLAQFPLETLVAIEPNPTRAALARRLGAGKLEQGTGLPDAQRALGPAGADLAYEVSGQPGVLDAAIAATGVEGRVVVGSFYGEKRAPLDLGGHFHRGRLQLVSSQVSHIAPGLRGRWDRARRMATAWRALGGVEAGALISHRVPFAEAPAAFRLLDAGPPGVLQVLLTHS